MTSGKRERMNEEKDRAKRATDKQRNHRGSNGGFFVIVCLHLAVALRFANLSIHGLDHESTNKQRSIAKGCLFGR